MLAVVISDALYQVEEVPFHSRLADFLSEMDVRFVKPLFPLFGLFTE